MGNVWKTIAIVLLIFIVAFFIWIFIPAPYEDFEEQIYEEQIITGESNPNFFYFPDRNISYSLNSSSWCEYERFSRIQRAFSIIENETEGLLSFNFELVDGDIIFSCPENDSEFGNSAGIGGPVYYEGYRDIVWGEISLFPYWEDEVICESFPTLEIHEILHVFGFDHVDNNQSIMSEGFDELTIDEDGDFQDYACQEIDIEIIDCLKNIYSNGASGVGCENLSSFNAN